MYIIYHHLLCPFARKVRIFLNENDIPFELVSGGKNANQVLKNIPKNISLPVVFSKEDNIFVYFSSIIIRYFVEKYGDRKNLLGESIKDKVQISQIDYWMDRNFFNDVTRFILTEKFYNYIFNKSPPNSCKLNIAKHNISIHFKYLEYLLSLNRYLAGERISLADITVASHISSIDYFGDIVWYRYQLLKQWYSIVKSRKSFNMILEDRINTLPPHTDYTKLDF